jgi:hypothetical protein
MLSVLLICGRLKKKKSEKLTELGRCMLRDGDDK